jgi:hypothetical protein
LKRGSGYTVIACLKKKEREREREERERKKEEGPPSMP